MYTRIYKKLKFCKLIILIFSVMIFATISLFISFFVYKIFFLEKNSYRDENYGKNIILNFMEKPILQINDDINIMYITSDGAEIKDEEDITMVNVNIESKNIKGFSKTVMIRKDELILDDRPYIVFYNTDE